MLNTFALAACIWYLQTDVYYFFILVITHYDTIMYKLLLGAHFASS